MRQLPQPAVDVVLGELPRQNVVVLVRRAVLEEEVDTVEPHVLPKGQHMLFLDMLDVAANAAERVAGELEVVRVFL
jgi:hypothetical protein